MVCARRFANTCDDGRTNTVVRSNMPHARNCSQAHFDESQRHCRASILDGKAFPDFVEALFERVEASMKRAIVEIENIAEREQSEDPVMALDINQHRLDRVSDESKDTQQVVHRTLPIPTRIPKFNLPSAPPLRELRKEVGSSPYPLSKGVIRLEPTTLHALRKVMGTSKPRILAALEPVPSFFDERSLSRHGNSV